MTSQDQLRQRARALVEGGTAQSRIAQEVSVSPSTISRFLRGDIQLSGPNEEALRAVVARMEAARDRDGGPLPEHMAFELAEKLRNGKLAVFVGAGVSHLAPKMGSEERLPLWSELARQVARDLRFQDADAYENPLELFDAIAYECGREELEERVRSRLDDRSFDLTRVHHLLRTLPFKTVLTTNYDRLLDRALAPERTPIVEDRDHDKADRRFVKLHGSLPSPLHTLTQEDYRNWAIRHPRSFGFLRELLVRESVLFIGYGIGDPHFDALLTQRRDAGRHREQGRHPPRSYVWAWRPVASKVRLYEWRDELSVVGIYEEEDWARALEQVARVLEHAPGEQVQSVRPEWTRDEDRTQWAQYVSAVDLHYGPANLEGLYVGRAYQRGLVRTEDLFVEPDVSEPDSQVPERVAKEESAESGSTPLPSADRSSPATSTSRARSKAHWKEPAKLREPHGEKRVPATEFLGSHAHVVLLGEPGQGKSTLLQWWLLQECRRVQDKLDDLGLPHAFIPPRPLFLRLAQWELDGGPEDLLGYARKKWLELANVSERAVEQWLSGPVVWLLDGIDEVRRPAMRTRLRALLGRVPFSPEHSGHRWILTSRPRGFLETGLDARWRQGDLAPLSTEQARSILEAWGTILARLEQVPFDARAVLGDLEGNPGLVRVSGSALLLTMVVLFFKSQRRLPRDRWEFYHRACQTLNDAWLRSRSPEVQREYAKLTYLERLLSFIAIEGMRRGWAVFPAWELESLVRRFFDLEQGSEITPGTLESAWEEFRAAAQDLIGAFVGTGPSEYGFLHLSFQEYYAALWLNRHEDEALDLARAKWDHPQWSELWSLYVLSIQNNLEAKRRFFDAVLTPDPNPELREVETLTQGRELRVLAWLGIGSSNEGSDQLFEQVGALLEPLASPDFVRSERLLLLRRLSPAIASWERLWPERLRAVLLAQLEDESLEVCWTAAKALAGQAGEAAVRTALLARLDDEAWPVRQAAAGALASQAGEPAVCAALLARLEDKARPARRTAAIALVGQAGEPAVRAMLLERLDDDDEDVRQAAARALYGQAGEPAVCAALLARLKDERWLVRQAATLGLWSQAGEPAVCAALLARLDDDHEKVRQAAARALTGQARKAEVRAALLARLDDDDEDVCQAVARVLKGQAREHAVRAALLARLDDGGPAARQAAAGALAGQAGEPAVRAALLARLEDEDRRVRQAAAEALMGQAGEPAVRAALLARLEDKSWAVRQVAVGALVGQAGEPAVRAALLARLEDESSAARQAAARALAGQAGEPAVRAALLARLEDKSWAARQAAAGALASQAGEPAVRAALLARVREDDDEDVREACAVSLEHWLAFVRHGLRNS